MRKNVYQHLSFLTVLHLFHSKTVFDVDIFQKTV